MQPAIVLEDASFPHGGGEMGELIRAFDWAKTPLGPLASWPQGRRTTIDLILRSPVPIVTLWGRDGVMIYNDAYAVFAGGRHPYLLGSKVLEGWPEVAEFNRRVMDVGLRGETLCFREEHLVLFRSGRPEDVWLDLDYSPILDEEGAPAGVMAIVIETTERVRAKRALEASEAQFRTLASAMPNQVWSASASGEIEWVNAQVLDYIGARASRVDERAWSRVLHRDDRERVLAAWQSALAAGEIYQSEFRMRRHDGSYRWHLTRATPIRDDDGRIVRWIGTNTDFHDKFEAERALREREADLARVQQIGKVGGVEVFLKHGFRNRRSPEYLVIHGLPPEAANETHEDWVRRIHPDDRAHTERAFIDAVRNGATDYTVEYRIIRPSDGEVRWIAVKAEIERDQDGKPLRLVGAHIDVTETKVAELALRESEERFRLIANSAPVPIWVTRLDGRRAFVNQAYMAFLGLSYDDCLVFDWRKALHPEDLDRILKDQLAGESSLKPFALEARYRHADGSWRWLRSESQPRWGADGRHVGFIGVAHDITAAKQAELELRNLNDRLAALVAARTLERDRIWSVSQDLLVVSDLHGTWLNVNPAATQTLGWSNEELVGRTVEWLLHPDDIGTTAAHVGSLRDGARTSRFENRLRHKDGGYRWMSWTATPHEGQIYAVARDVTEEKEAAETLLRTEEALRQSQKMEAVGQLTGGIAHDFNNLLQGIMGSLEQIQRRLAEGRLSEIGRFAAAARTSADRAAALTHRLLAFSRRQPLDPKPLAANPLMRSMDDLLRRSLGEGINLAFDLADELWLTLCDQNQLENAILNLAINARDAMPDGGHLRIETQNVHVGPNAGDAAPGDYVAIAVSDTGTGMPPDVMARAFDPFFTTKPIGHGTGLGLSMIYGFARQSEGAVRLESEVGKGTRVTLLLPRHEGLAESKVLPEIPTKPESKGHGRTILVIEDEPLVRLLIVDVLEEMGFLIIEAADGPSGLSILQSSQHIDLLITDVGLPGLNGRQVADAARALRPALKVLFMTGYAEKTLAQDIIAADMQMITKPFAMDHLVKRLRDMLD